MAKLNEHDASKIDASSHRKITWQTSTCPTKLPMFISRALEQYFELRVNNAWQGGHILKGKKTTAHSIIFSSNDYLSISRHPRILEAQMRAMHEYGNGQMQSPVFLSDDGIFSECEQQFAAFLQHPASLLAQSGWCANVGLIQALATRELPVYLDFYTHMSFWEGAKAARAKPIPFRHNSISSLRKRLMTHGPGIIAVDSIYSTTGTISPLSEYVKLAQEFECFLIVDESHSLGTHGPNGRGLVVELGLSDKVPIVTASLAKAFSGRGGLIAGSQTLIEFIRNNALPIIFSSALSPHDITGFLASLAVITDENWRRESLHANATYLRNELMTIGINLFGSDSQIIPLFAGSEENTIWLRNELEHANIHGSVFCAPATPKNNALIRLSINTMHRQEQLEHVVTCLKKLTFLRRDLPLFNCEPE